MTIEICLVIITLTLLVLVGVVLFAVIKIVKSIREREADFHSLATGAKDLINSLKHLSGIAKEKAEKFSSLASSLGLLKEKIGFGLFPPQEKKRSETIGQAIKWLALTVSLIKLTKEVRNRNEK